MKTLLKQLIQAPSTTANGELKAAQILHNAFSDAGIHAELDQWDDNRANVTAVLQGKNSDHAILIGCHLDVVEPGQAKWKYEPFAAIEENGKIFGRGAADMKGGLVAAVETMIRLHKNGQKPAHDIVLVACAGEETDSSGVKRFLKSKFAQRNYSGVLVPEPTDMHPVTAHRGILWVEINTHGKAAHGSVPHLGKNAILMTNEIINELKNFDFQAGEHPLLGTCTMSINTIQGGSGDNIVPDSCRTVIDIRVLPSQQKEQTLNQLQQLIDKLSAKNEDFKADLNLLRSVPAMATDNCCDFVKHVCSVVNMQPQVVPYTSDGPFFAQLGAPVVICGPGKSEQCHQADEHIDLKDLEHGAAAFEIILCNF